MAIKAVRARRQAKNPCRGWEDPILSMSARVEREKLKRDETDKLLRSGVKKSSQKPF